MLAQHLLKTYSEVLDVKKLTYVTLTNGTTVNTTDKMFYGSNNELQFQGVDGFNTGFTDEVGYCLQEQQRLIIKD